MAGFFVRPLNGVCPSPPNGVRQNALIGAGMGRYLGRIVTCRAFSLPEHIIEVYDSASRYGFFHVKGLHP